MPSMKPRKPDANEPRPGRHVLFIAFLAIAAIAVVAGVAYDHYRKPAATESTQAAATPVGTVQETKRIAFIGDSYTAGTGAPDGEGYAWLVAKNFNVNAQVSAEENAGYIKPGGSGRTMINLVQGAEAAFSPANVIVLAGGYNDNLGAPPSSVGFRAAVQATFTAAREWSPDADIIVLGPWTPTGVPTTNQSIVNDVLREESQSSGFMFVDTIRPPMVTSEMIGSDGFHPTPEGHQQLADKVVAALRDRIPAFA